MGKAKREKEERDLERRREDAERSNRTLLSSSCVWFVSKREKKGKACFTPLATYFQGSQRSFGLLLAFGGLLSHSMSEENLFFRRFIILREEIQSERTNIHRSYVIGVGFVVFLDVVTEKEIQSRDLDLREGKDGEERRDRLTLVIFEKHVVEMMFTVFLSFQIFFR